MIQFFAAEDYLEKKLLAVLEANRKYALQNDWLRTVNTQLRKERNLIASNKIKKLEAQNKKLKHSIHKAYNKHIKPAQAEKFKEDLTYALNNSNEPRTIGLRYYNGKLKKSQHFAKCDWENGCHAGYNLTYKGVNKVIETMDFNFIASSRKEAESFLDMSQIESLEFGRMLTSEENRLFEITKLYNEK